MAKRAFINGHAITACQYGNIVEIEMIDKYGRLERARMASKADAERVFNLFCMDARNM